jgi:hypothetical protein
MNMPSKSGHPVHQIIGEHPAETLEDFIYAMSQEDFIMVDEIYKDSHNGGHFSNGIVALNPLFIGKVKVLQP